MLTIIANPRARHQVEHQEALAAGLKVHGYPHVLSHSETHVESNIVACWGWRIGKRLKDRGCRVLVMERGYLGDRFSNTSLGFNGLNGHAQFPKYNVDDSRLKKLGIELKPWKKGGDYALILGQVPHDASLQGRDMVPWYRDIANEIKVRHALPVLFRPHPDLAKKGMTQNVPNAEPSQGSLSDALAGAAFTVCFNSNSSVDSVIAGVPCVVGDRGSMAYDMCGHDIESIIRPDRENWANALAFKQWTIEEIRSGDALKGIIPML